MDETWAQIPDIRRPKVAMALGGGGARGIAHVLALEALDEMGSSHVAIAGYPWGRLSAARMPPELRDVLFGIIYYES